MLPLLTGVNPESGSVRVDFKRALESVFLRDIDRWAEDKLSENLAVKRRKKLNVA
jgi:murein L,D-transpeptidase YcbB/YkuD